MIEKKELPKKERTAKNIREMTESVNWYFKTKLGNNNEIIPIEPEEAYWIACTMYNGNYIRMFLDADYVSAVFCFSRLQKGVKNRIININEVILALLEMNAEKQLKCLWAETVNIKAGRSYE